MKLAEVDQTRTEVVHGDLFGLPREQAVRYVSMMDFLEHLADLDSVGRAIDAAVAVSREFVFINHPSFEDERFLRDLGFKLYWEDWTGHTVHPMLDFLLQRLTRAGASEVELSFRQPIENTFNSAVLPVEAPRNSHSYEPVKHPPQIVFGFPWNALWANSDHRQESQVNGLELMRLVAPELFCCRLRPHHDFRPTCRIGFVLSSLNYF